jgi:subtilisin family serine protease
MLPADRSSGAAAVIETLEERALLAGEPWGGIPKLIGQDQAVAHYPAINGSGVSVAIIDTGVDYNHPNLGGGFGPGKKVVAGYDFVDNDPDPMDTDGHGTGVAGVIAASSFVFQGAKYQGVAPSVNLIALRTDPGTFGWPELAPRLEAALQWVIAHRTQYDIVAINMSVGVESDGLDPAATVVTDELATLKQMGVVLVAASGNDSGHPVGIVEYTASDPSVLAVGSVNSADAISSFTRRNQTLDLLAPGESAVTLYYVPGENHHIMLAATGTSFATPFVTGVAALIKQINPAVTSDQFLSILGRSGTARFDSLTELTFPRINIDAAIALAITELNAPPTVMLAQFHYLTAPRALVFRFSEDVFASLGLEDLSVINLATNQPVTGLSYRYELQTNTATFTFAGVPADGNYRATLLSNGIRDSSNAALDGDGNGSPGGDFHLDFFLLRGDANRDRTVNFADLVVVAQNYGSSSGATWAQGDFDGDGAVNFNDLVTLAQMYNKTLAGAAVSLASEELLARVKVQPRPLPRINPSVRRGISPVQGSLRKRVGVGGVFGLA